MSEQGATPSPKLLDRSDVRVKHAEGFAGAVADRIVVLRLGRNNGVFYPDSSNQELVAAITGATENAVSRRAARAQEQQAS